MIYSTEQAPNVVEVMPATNGNNGGGFGGYGGDWAGFIVLFLIFACFGWGGYGFGGMGGGNGAMANGALTRADLCSEFNFNGLENSVRGIQQGICDSTFALNNTITGGFNGVNSAICNLGYSVQQGFNDTNVAFMQGFNNLQSLISNCCCQTQRAIDGVNYNMATNTCAIQTSIANATRDIVDAQNCNTRAILDRLTQNKIDSLQSENAALRLSASQDRQNALLTSAMSAQTNQILGTLNPTPIPAYQVPNPNCCYNANQCC